MYQVNGEELKASEGSSLQLWMPETVARYFTRNIASIELTREDAVPEVASVDPMYRNKIEIKNSADGCAFEAGDEITFEGVADDCGTPRRGHRVLLRRRAYLDGVRDGRRHRRQVGELAVHHFVRRGGRLRDDRARPHGRRRGVAAVRQPFLCGALASAIRCIFP